jgi:adenine-specific DNA-methyltransferase
MRRMLPKAEFGGGVSGNNSVPALKNFLSEINQGMMPMSLWKHGLAGHTQDAKKEMLALFGEEPFGTPKPESLLHTILHIATNPGDLVLDSFLGSGTTAAVAHKMGRRWIGIEMGEHARHALPAASGESRRWRDGRHFGCRGLAGRRRLSFSSLGEAVFDAEGGINPAVRFASLAAYLWHFETGSRRRKLSIRPALAHMKTPPITCSTTASSATAARPAAMC